jgi:hypothetical protein
MNQARKFLEERINLFLTNPLEVEVITVTNLKVSYRNATSKENKAYQEYHKKMFRNKQHLGAFDDYALMVAPQIFDDLSWMCTMHQDQRLLGLRYFDQLEITFLTDAEFLLIKPLAMQEKRLIDRRMGPEQERYNEKTRKEMQSLYDFALQTHESEKGTNAKMHKDITGGTTNSQTTNVAWGYMKKFQDRIREINRDQAFGFVNKPSLDNVIAFEKARNQNIV